MGVMMTKRDEIGWCILRTSARQTLDLAASLADAGYDVWTPVEIRERLAGRKRELVEQRIAIVPGYVFARMDDLTGLLSLSRSPTLNYLAWDAEKGRMVGKGHPHFSVFHLHGRCRPQHDKSLAPLRAIEESLQKAAARRKEQAKHKGPIPQFRVGQLVRVDGGGFEGLTMTVAKANDGKQVTLIHPDWVWTVEISAWKLRDIQAIQAEPEQGDALAA